VFNFRELGAMAGMPRRYMDYSDWDSFLMYQQSIIVSVMVLAFGLVLNVLNVLIGLIRRRKMDID
jgi:heme/copper-type cytochrome/quinol oxidase subunit 1